jgi:LmbE family N-acetylglucosaminyl deacetylase
MDPLVVLSAHPDDAILSAGQVIGSWPGAHVVTVCSHAPETPMSTDYDQRSGFSSARQAAYCRRREDRAACAVLGASPVHLGMVDGQYGTPLKPSVVAAQLVPVLVTIQPRVIVCPMGLVHPDHIAVAEACRLLFHSDVPAEVWLYEDQPSRVLYPLSVLDGMNAWETAGFKLTLDFLGTSDLDRKEEAVRCYRSQLWALDLHAVLCPERLWKVTT